MTMSSSYLLQLAISPELLHGCVDLETLPHKGPVVFLAAPFGSSCSDSHAHHSSGSSSPGCGEDNPTRFGSF